MKRIAFLILVLFILVGCRKSKQKVAPTGNNFPPPTEVNKTSQDTMVQATKQKNTLESLVTLPTATSPEFNGLKGARLPFFSVNSSKILNRKTHLLLDIKNRKMYLLTGRDSIPNPNNTLLLDTDNMTIKALQNGGTSVHFRSQHKPDNWHMHQVNTYTTTIEKDNYQDIIYAKVGPYEYYRNAPTIGWKKASQPSSNYVRSFSKKVPVGGYKVKAGETLNGIARRHKISTDKLFYLNPHLGNSSNIAIGEILKVK